MASKKGTCSGISRVRKREFPDDPSKWGCLAPPSPNGKCHYHGKWSGRPPKTGRHAKVLGPFLAKYTELLEADDLLDLKPTLALLDLQMDKVIERAAKYKETPDWRKGIHEDLLQLQMVATGGDMAKILERLKEVINKVNRGVEEDQILASIMVLAERRANRTERAIEVIAKSQEVITQQQLWAFLALIADIIVKETGNDSTRILHVIDRSLREHHGLAIWKEEQAQLAQQAS